jgi:CheY-like chemotaxis protein
MLKHLGYRVDVAANGKEAVEAFERVPYAAVLMDCQMPEMNGYEASTAIRRLEAPGHRVPIIAVTASAIMGEEDRCLAAGMDAYVTKPVTAQVLGEALAKLIAGRPGEGPVEVLDRATLDGLWEMGGNSPALIEEVADLFIGAAPAEIARLHGAVASVDFEVTAHVAHRLRGSCAAVGATGMGSVAAEIEADAIEHRSDNLAVGVARLEQSFDDVRDALRAAAASAPAGRR